MAQRFVTDQGTMIIPSAAATYKVATANSGLSATGIVALVGEAEAGPDFSIEDDLDDVTFGPDQEADVIAKFRSGPLVDAFRAASAPSNDPRISGAPSRLVLVKTNQSTKASLTVDKYDTTDYGVLADKSYGNLGNLISVDLDAADTEVIPTTGAFTYIPAVGSVEYNMRANGGASVGGTLSANTSPTALVSTIAALAGVIATGGTNRNVTTGLASPDTIALTVISGNSVQIDIAGGVWGTTPTVGDTMTISTGSVIDGGVGEENTGAYVVTGATTTQILATKLSDAGKTSPAGVPGTITAPASVGAIAFSGTPANDIAVYAPVTISLEAGDPLDGRGKSLEIAQLTGGTDLLERTAYALGTTTRIVDGASGNWVSRSASPQLLTSAVEYRVKVTAARQFDNMSEELEAGGEVAFRVGYTGTTASLTVSDTTLTITVAGGTGTSQTCNLRDFQTLADLATYLNSKTGYTCSVGNAALGNLPAAALDDQTAIGAATTHGVATCRLKVDAYRFFQKISEESTLLEFTTTGGDSEQALSGIPAPAALTYLTGGAKGSTLSAQVLAALAALEKVQANFVVPLFSTDAADDIVDGETESGSTYAIDAVNLAAKTHAISMSKLKARKNRIAIVSKRTTFDDAKESASNLASFRAAMTFQDVRNLSVDGTIKQFKPWMGAALAAGLQAAGGYRAIVRKLANINGALQAEGDFDDRVNSNVEDALTSGLLPLRRNDTGGYYWVSDQTTYTKDDNFVYNSIQAVYAADIIALSTAQRMEDAFVGESVADVSAAVAMSFLEGIMADFLRLKFIAPSDDAPRGFRNAKIVINGNTMQVNLEVKLAGALYFIPVAFLISAVKQTAG